MKNKILKFLGLLVLSISFASCGNRNDSSTSESISDVGNSVSTVDSISIVDSISTGGNVTVSETVSTSAHEHFYEGFEYDGTHHWHECEECEDIIGKEVHSFVENITNPATHVSIGEARFECECGYYYTADIPMIEHSYTVHHDEYEHWEECECGDKRNIEAHIFGLGVVVEQPTCTEEGIERFECECGYFYTAPIAKIAHDHSEEWSYDEMHHWHECECGDQEDVAEHIFVDGICECGRVELANGIIITPDALTLTVGDTEDLTIAITPSGIQGLVPVVFSSDTPSVATVNQDGKVTAVSKGTANITATVNDGSGTSDTIVVTVNKKFTKMEDVIASGIANAEYNVIGRVVAIYSGNLYQGIYIANGNYALQVFKAAITVEVEIGDLVEVTGKYLWYASNRTTELDISAGSIEVINEVPAGVIFAEPVEYVFDDVTWSTITSSPTGSDNVYTNRPVTVTGLVEVAANASQITINVDGTSILVFFRNAADIGQTIYDDFAELEIGDEVTITGVIGSYNGATQIVAPQSPVLVPIDYVARLVTKGTTTKFDTLSEAILAAPTDGALATITLMDDSVGCGVEIVAGQNIILDLNGHTYSVSSPTVGSPGTETNGFRFVQGSATTIKNGTIDCAEENTVAILLQKYNDLILEDVTIDSSKGTNSYNYAVSTNAGTTTFKGATHIIAREDDGVAFDLCYFQRYTEGLKVIVDPTFTGSFTGKIEYANYPTVQEAEWYLKTLFVKDGKEYYVKNADVIGHKTERQYDNYAAFLADLKPVNNIVSIPNTTIASIASSKSWVNGNAYTPFMLDDVVEVNCEGGANAGKYYNTGNAIRIYGSSSDKIVISVPEGYELRSVTLTFTLDGVSQLPTCVSGVANTFEAGANTQTVSFAASGSSGHVRISAISVSYAVL